MEKLIPITNFLKMTPEAPEYSARNQHYLISANPTYYLDKDGQQEEQGAPLAASLAWAKITATITGNIMHMVASTEGTYAVYAVTDQFKVYGITTAGATDLGFPSGAPIANAGGRLGIAGGYLFAVVTGQVYKMQLPGNPWFPVGGPISSPGGVHFLEPFLDFMTLADATSGGNSYSIVKKIDVTSFLITTAFDIGVGWGITGFKNYNNKYLAISAGRTSGAGGVFGYPQNYIFLWDGISSRYNYSVKVPGRYISMKVIDSVLYVAVQVSSSKTIMYYLAGTALKRVFNPSYSQISSIAGLGSPVADPIFDYQNNLGVRLEGTTEFPTNNILMVHGLQDVGTSEFILTTGFKFDQFCVGYDGVLYANLYKLASDSDIYYYPPTSSTYDHIFYRSQWIPVKNLQAIDIYYDTPPQAGSDAINTTIYGRGEDIRLPTPGFSTTVLASITPTNHLTPNRTRLDVKGFVGNKLRIQLSTINSTWRPIIRAIIPITK